MPQFLWKLLVICVCGLWQVPVVTWPVTLWAWLRLFCALRSPVIKLPTFIWQYYISWCEVEQALCMIDWTEKNGDCQCDHPKGRIRIKIGQNGWDKIAKILDLGSKGIFLRNHLVFILPQAGGMLLRFTHSEIVESKKFDNRRLVLKNRPLCGFR